MTLKAMDRVQNTSLNNPYNKKAYRWEDDNTDHRGKVGEGVLSEGTGVPEESQQELREYTQSKRLEVRMEKTDLKSKRPVQRWKDLPCVSSSVSQSSGRVLLGLHAQTRGVVPGRNRLRLSFPRRYGSKNLRRSRNKSKKPDLTQNYAAMDNQKEKNSAQDNPEQNNSDQGTPKDRLPALLRLGRKTR